MYVTYLELRKVKIQDVPEDVRDVHKNIYDLPIFEKHVYEVPLLCRFERCPAVTLAGSLEETPKRLLLPLLMNAEDSFVLDRGQKWHFIFNLLGTNEHEI